LKHGLYDSYFLIIYSWNYIDEENIYYFSNVHYSFYNISKEEMKKHGK